MKNFAFWVALAVLAVLCPLSWVMTGLSTNPAVIGEFVTENLPSVRVLLTTFLVALLVSTIKPVKRPVTEQGVQV